MICRVYIERYLFTSDFEFINFGNMKILFLAFPMRSLRLRIKIFSKKLHSIIVVGH